MAQFAKATFSHASYAAFRPAYPADLYVTILNYHHGRWLQCIDLGTGHGLVARTFMPYFDEVMGIDPSAGMLEQARSLTPKERLFSNLSYREASAESLPFLQESSVDMVVAAQAAHWFDYSRLFPELKRVVRPGGTLAFWAYKDHVFVDYPKATDVLNRYAYGDDHNLLGPYWSQPGRSYVQSKLHNITPPAAEWEDVQRLEYEPGTQGAGSGEGTPLLRSTLTLVLCSRIRMPPFIARKRRLSSSPFSSDHTAPKKQRRKPTVFDAADERATGSLNANQSFINGLAGSETDTSLSDVSSAEFEDVAPQPATKKQKLDHPDEDDEEVDWEDAMHGALPDDSLSAAIQPSGDLELTLDKGSRVSFALPQGQKKGPSKIERQIRVVTHCMHVQFLLFHNSMRSRWACDTEVQKILVDQLPPTIQQVIGTWRLASGLPQEKHDKASEDKLKQTKGKRGKAQKSHDVRSQRDWGKPAERQEKGAANMSHGDPVYRLLKALAAYWKKRFTITAPCLRKQGYKSLARLEEEIASFKNDEHDPEEHGERISNLDDFKDRAKIYEGSRDIGAQLFVALLRGLGLETRLVASLQPVGFGWNKNEEASPKKKRSSQNRPAKRSHETHIASDVPDDHPDTKSGVTRGKKLKKNLQEQWSGKNQKAVNGSKDIPIDLPDSSGSELSSIGQEDSEDDESVIDVTPSTPRAKPNMPYDRDLVFPTYWAEVISPITNEVYPVDPLILTPAVATKPEHLAAFEPRGTKADKAKQVFAYIIAYSPDGTAKDVTTRYLKKHMWPGRTKGVRLPVEKVPVYNSKGKIKHHEQYDWFKTVMSGYARPDRMRTAVDDIEEAKALKPTKPEKKDPSKAAGEGTLQFYRTSAEYVLERHLRREEAIAPGSEPVRYFSSTTTGKNGGGSSEATPAKTPEPVFLRKDILICRTAESWHKEGRQILPGQLPLKMVPIRAVTLTRKREVEEAERRRNADDGSGNSGEKLKQGLYALSQTDFIIPPPIINGVIPKNAYGNMDCFVPTMVPRGAVHIPLRSTGKICKRLGIDYAEAVTGFEFGKQRAVPVVEGVVVAVENEAWVRGEWERDEVERMRKEEGKRGKVAVGMWRRFLVGLRVVRRVREVYGGEEGGRGGDGGEERNPFTNRKKTEEGREAIKVPDDIQANEDEDTAGGGGFFLPGSSSSPTPPPPPARSKNLPATTPSKREPSPQPNIPGTQGGEVEEEEDIAGKGGFFPEASPLPPQGQQENLSPSPPSPPARRPKPSTKPTKRKPPRKPNTRPTGTTPKRRSTRQTGRRSRYFEPNSEEEGESK
ncbi:MAG: hypothetical protein Q9219_001144 [cf. Caloplaca sp. 3 TL-2023]